MITLPVIRLLSASPGGGRSRTWCLKRSCALSGLLQAVPETAAAADADEIRYDFRPGVRELLLTTLDFERIRGVVVRVSDFLERALGGWGRAGACTLRALSERPVARHRSTEASGRAAEGPFASISSAILRGARISISRAVAASDPYPFRSVCLLLVTAADGTRLQGTGWLAGPRTVITAGHLVYLPSSGGWVRQAEVIVRGADAPPQGLDTHGTLHARE